MSGGGSGIRDAPLVRLVSGIVTGRQRNKETSEGRHAGLRIDAKLTTVTLARVRLESGGEDLEAGAVEVLL